MDSLQKNKQYQEERKKKIMSDKVQEKIEKGKVLNKEKSQKILKARKSRIASSVKVSNLTKKVGKGILIGSKKKKTSIATLKKTKRKELLLRAKQVVYARDKNTCQKCMKVCEGRNRQASHVIPVSATGRLALYPINMKVLCMHCHLQRRHKNPIEASDRFENKFPERLKELKKLKLNIPMGSITMDELDKIEEMITKDESKIFII